MKYAAILAVGALAAWGAGAYWLNQYREAQGHYVANAGASSRFVLDKVETAFANIYQNIRTISLIPGVRAIDRHAENLSDEAKTTIQQVYNNLGTNVDVSEVYILPVDFDPEKVDPATGHHETPIVAFDQLIVPNAAVAVADDGGEAAAAKISADSLSR